MYLNKVSRKDMNFLAVYENLMKEKTHPIPCTCAACLFPKYIERSKQRRFQGRPYEKMTFFVYWLMIEIKKSKLVENQGANNINEKSTIFF